MYTCLPMYLRGGVDCTDFGRTMKCCERSSRSQRYLTFCNTEFPCRYIFVLWSYSVYYGHVYINLGIRGIIGLCIPVMVKCISPGNLVVMNYRVVIFQCFCIHGFSMNKLCITAMVFLYCFYIGTHAHKYRFL